jgi:hypothetical protein
MSVALRNAVYYFGRITCIIMLRSKALNKVVPTRRDEVKGRVWQRAEDGRLFFFVFRAYGIPPSALQPTEAYCTNPRFWFPVHLQRSSTSDGVRDLYQRKEKLWARNGR